MHNVFDVNKGKITDISPDGIVTIKLKYDDWHTLVNRQYKECYVELIDSRPLSDKQRRFCWSLISAIADWQGQSRGETAREMANEARKLDFLINEIGENAERLFSLSNAPMSLVAAYQRYLVRFVVENDIPTTFPLQDYADDISDYVYSCLISKVCCVCRRHAELHHIERVGMGRNRNEICHEGMEALPLCREHHAEAHTMSDNEFFDRYHLDGGIALDRTLCRLWKLKGEKNV